MAVGLQANNNRIAKNTIFLYARMFVVLLISLYTTRVVLRILGVEDYGIYNVVGGFVSMFGFLNTAMANGIQRFYNYNLGKYGEEGLIGTYNCALRIQILLALIIFVVIEGIGKWYINNIMVIPEGRIMAANIVFQFSVFSMLVVILQIPFSGAIMAMEKMDYYAFVSILDALLKLGFVFLLQVISYDKLAVWGVLTLIISIVNLLLYYVYCKKYFSFLKLNKAYNKQEFFSMLSFSGWNLFGSFGNIMKDQGLNMILNLFFGPVVNAARGISYQISSAMQSFISNNSIAVRPQLMQSYAQGDIRRTFKLMFAVSKFNYYLLMIMAVPVGVEIDFILSLWLGNNVPDHTASFSLLILAICFINNLNTPISLVVHATGVMKNYQIYSTIISLLSLPASYLVLKAGAKPEMAFVVVLIATIITQIVDVYILKTIVCYSTKAYGTEVIIPCVLVTLIVVLLTKGISLIIPEGWINFIFVVFFGVIICIGTTYMIGINKDEKKLLKEMVLKLIRKQN